VRQPLRQRPSLERASGLHGWIGRAERARFAARLVFRHCVGP
jgi:hypothetical protein